MMKISTLAALGTFALAGVAAFTVACDDGGASVDCTADADCANEAENTVCDPDVLVCVAPSDPTCADDADCDLANSDSPTSAEACTADSDCDSSNGPAVCVTDGVGTTYCAIEDGAGVESCAENAAGPFDVATVDGKDVCVVSSGQSCTDGQCVDG